MGNNLENWNGITYAGLTKGRVVASSQEVNKAPHDWDVRPTC